MKITVCRFILDKSAPHDLCAVPMLDVAWSLLGEAEVKEHCSCHKVQNLTVFLCLSMSLHTNRHSSIPPRATDLELQVIVVAPCDEALYQSSVLLSKNK